MKCYYQPIEDAVGMCKICNKGLSVDFAVDTGHGLACKGKCEQELQEWVVIAERTKATSAKNAAIINRSTSSLRSTAVFNTVIGATFFGLGAYRSFEPLLTVLGALFLAYGGYSLLAQLRKEQKK
jgi:hypothetical protein